MKNKVIWIVCQYACKPENGVLLRQYNFASEWANAGYEVYVIASGVHHYLLREKPKLTESINIEKVKNFNFVWLDLPKYSHAHNKKRILGWFAFTLKLFSVAKKIPKPDAILYSSPAPFGILSSYRIAKKYKAKLIFEVRDIWPLTLVELGGYSPKHPFVQLMQWTEDFAYKKSDLVISNLKYAVDHMQSRGMDRAKFHWVPNGFAPSELANIAPLDSQVASKIPSDKFVIGYAGTLGLANNLDTFLEAATALKEDKNIFFALLGDGSYRSLLEEKAKQLELDNLVFLGSVPKNQVQSFLARLDVCFIGLKSDSLFRFGVSPNKLFDYFYAAKPVIYAIDSGAYKPVEEAKAGIQIAPENPQELVAAIKKIHSLTPKEREQMGNSGKEFVLENHNYEKLSTNLLQLISD